MSSTAAIHDVPPPALHYSSGEFTPALWLTAPQRAHTLWREGLALADRSYAAHTTATYKSQFGRFCQWLAGNGLKLDTIGEAELARFLEAIQGREGRQPSIRTKRMYLAEIDRVMAHLVSVGTRTERPTRALIERLSKKEPMKPRNIVLRGAGFAPALRQYLWETALSSKATPRQVREAACAALMIDCGLTVKELQKLRMTDFTPAQDGSPARLHAPGHRVLKARDLNMSGWSAELLQGWIRLRLDSLPLPRSQAEEQRTKIFVHEAFADMNRERSLRATTVHRSTHAACKACGVDAGPQVLRNEYVAGLLRSGIEPLQVRDMAGLHDLDQIYAMRQALGMAERGNAVSRPAEHL